MLRLHTAAPILDTHTDQKAAVRALSDDDLLYQLGISTDSSLFVLAEAIDRELVVFSPRQYRYVGRSKKR
jgi:hypothetical protein